MKKLKELWASAREKMKGNEKAALLFVAFMLGTVQFAHFYAGMLEADKASPEPVEIVALAPEPSPVVTQVPVNTFKPIPAPVVVPSKAQPVTVQITNAIPAPVVAPETPPVPEPAVQVAPAPAPKFVRPSRIPPELMITPENIRRLQGGNEAPGMFDTDFTELPKESK